MVEQLVIDVNVFLNSMTTVERNKPLQVEAVELLRRVHVGHKAAEVQLRHPPLFILEVFSASNRQVAPLVVALRGVAQRTAADLD